MICCRPGRRAVLRWAAVVAGASLLPVTDPEQAYAAARKAGAVAPVDLELVTLTETSAIFTWYTGVPGTSDDLGRMLPAPADSEIVYGTHPGRLNRSVHLRGRTPYHLVEITGLEPGRTYYYQARSAGRPATATPIFAGNAAGTTPYGLGTSGPFAFTTPQPPPGRFLFAIALCNDLHLGETVAGLIGGLPGIRGISQLPGHPPYPEIMARSLTEEARRRGARYLLAAGDLTSEAAPADAASAKRLLDGFGTYQADYFVTRGNHDRAHSGDAYAACSPGRWQGNDCFGDEFFGRDVTYFSRDLQGLRIVGLDTYDKPGNGGDSGGLSAEQMAWFQGELKAHRDQPTIVFGHHPLYTESDPLAITGAHSLATEQALAIMGTYDRTPGVFLHHAGHTHRNRRAVSPLAPGVVQQEVAAAKEYPGGFSLLRLHTGGYAVNFYKSPSAEARAWSERSRQEINGLWPQLALGARVEDRNSVVVRDLSGVGRR